MGVDQRAKVLIGDITAFQTSCAAPDTQKRCVAVLLRAIVSVRNREYCSYWRSALDLQQRHRLTWGN